MSKRYQMASKVNGSMEGGRDHADEDLDSGVSNPGSDNDTDALIKQIKPSSSSRFSPNGLNTSKEDGSFGNLSRRISSHSGITTVPCPTCSGKGKLSQAQSDTMVALIPMHDQRLDPKRTKLKLAIVFTLLVIIGAMCFAFLYPRKVTVSIDNAVVDTISKALSNHIRINMTVSAFLNNTNFFTVHFSEMSIQVLFLDTKDQTSHEVGNIVINQDISLALRKNLKKQFLVATLYTDMDAKIVNRVCLKFKQYFLIKVLITSRVKYWLHYEQLSAYKFYYIDCSNAVAALLKPVKYNVHTTTGLPM